MQVWIPRYRIATFKARRQVPHTKRVTAERYRGVYIISAPYYC